ncbi:hypothetical protein BD310DRAFT_828132, partial [Dichomitus squalens]
AALFVHDFNLTFDSEVALFWTGGHLSGATVLFLLNRYITLASQVMGLIPSSSVVRVCHYVYVAVTVLEALQYLPWAAFSALRTYALCPDPYRWLISVSVFALSSVPIVTEMWGNLYGLSFVNDPVLGIISISPISASTNLKSDVTVEVVTRSCLIASDLVVVCVTWLRTYETAKLSLGRLGKRSFASILLLDGMYQRSSLQPDEHSYQNPMFLFSLTSILTSRFLIDLQKAQRKLAGSSQSVSLGEVALQPQTSGNTSRLIGSLGAQLSFHEVDEEEEENEGEQAS